MHFLLSIVYDIMFCVYGSRNILSTGLKLLCEIALTHKYKYISLLLQWKWIFYSSMTTTIIEMYHEYIEDIYYINGCLWTL